MPSHPYVTDRHLARRAHRRRSGRALVALAVVATVFAAGMTVVAAPGEAHLASRPTSRPNREPSAVFTASATSGIAPLQVRFDASGSRDPDGYVLTYAWAFGDGTMASGATAAHFFNVPGAYSVSLTVTDNRGEAVSSSTTVTVAAGTMSSPPPPPPPPPPPSGPDTAPTGWAIYDMNADPAHDLSVVPKLDTARPGVVRWLVSIDRYMPNGRARVDWSAYAPFFRKIRDIGAPLVITLFVHGQCWAGTSAAPLFGWCPNGGLVKDAWAADSMRLWFKDPSDSYRPFLEDLLDAALVYVPAEQISVAPWNEPDLRFTLGGAQPNYLTPWVNWSTYGLDNGYWTGGTAKMAELYGIVKDVLARKTGGRSKVASNLVFEDWVAALAPQVETLELHAYMNEPSPKASHIVNRVEELVARWDRYKPGLPFVVSEAGVITYPERNVTAAEATELRAAHAELARRYGARYRGMALHTGTPPFAGDRPWWDTAYAPV